MIHQATIAEAEFNAAMSEMALQDAATEMVQFLTAVEFGTCQAKTPQAAAILQKAVEMKMMTVKQYGTLPAIYQVVSTPQHLRA